MSVAFDETSHYNNGNNSQIMDDNQNGNVKEEFTSDFAANDQFANDQQDPSNDFSSDQQPTQTYQEGDEHQGNGDIKGEQGDVTGGSGENGNGHADSASGVDKNGNQMEPEQFRKVFIGGLSYKTDDETLKNYFGKYGDLVDYVVMKDGQSGRSRGFGFVTYSDSYMVDELMKNRPHIIDGRQVEPKRATPREVRDSGRAEVQMTVKKLFIGGLRDPISEEDLKNYFSAYGNIVEAVVMKEKDTNKSRGFGFVTFDDYDPVDKIILQKHHNINGVNVHTQKALPKDYEQGGQQGGRGSQGMMGGPNQRGGGGFKNRNIPNRGGGMMRNPQQQFDGGNMGMNPYQGGYMGGPKMMGGPMMGGGMGNMGGMGMMGNGQMGGMGGPMGGGGRGMGGMKMGGGGPIRNQFNQQGRSGPYGMGGGGFRGGRGGRGGGRGGNRGGGRGGGNPGGPSQ